MVKENGTETRTRIQFPADDRERQCARAADYLEAHPGSGLRELAAGADLGSASKVISAMPEFGYRIRRQWERVFCADGMHTRRTMRYWLENRPRSTQTELF